MVVTSQTIFGPSGLVAQAGRWPKQHRLPGYPLRSANSTAMWSLEGSTPCTQRSQGIGWLTCQSDHFITNPPTPGLKIGTGWDPPHKCVPYVNEASGQGAFPSTESPKENSAARAHRAAAGYGAHQAKGRVYSECAKLRMVEMEHTWHTGY